MFDSKEPDMTMFDKVKAFLAVHWRGLVCLLAPIILVALIVPLPAEKFQWCAYCLVLMAIYWVTECIPIAVTSFLPIVIFPMTEILTTTEVCRAYMSDPVMMFIGSLFLAFAVEQSGLHKRLAYNAIRILGYSHLKLLLAVCIVTCFVSMWVTNTAATTMMIPILFAVLRVFDEQNICKLYEKDRSGQEIATDVTSAYFCAITYSATIGGIGTLVGTATNLTFKGLFQTAYPTAPEYLSFPKFSAFGVPYMILMMTATYILMAIQYFGFLRPKSNAKKRAIISKKGKEAAEKAIAEERKKMGKFSFWEGIVLVLFATAMICFFCRSPQVFKGWGDIVQEKFKDHPSPRDSALAMLISFLMMLLPSTLAFFSNFRAKFYNELPKGKIVSALDWTKLNAGMPYSFMFLLGGGFALAEGAKTSGLNDKIGETLKKLESLPNLVIILLIILIVIFITNFASNVAVANVMAPISMELAKQIKRNPLWYCIVTGFCASHCLMVPVGTPGNLIVQSAAHIPTIKMIKAGFAPTIAIIIISWVLMSFYAPIIWPDLNTLPEWAGGSTE